MYTTCTASITSYEIELYMIIITTAACLFASERASEAFKAKKTGGASSLLIRDFFAILLAEFLLFILLHPSSHAHVK